RTSGRNRCWPCHFSLAVSSPRPPRPRWRSAGRRRSTTHPVAGRSAAEEGGGESFLPREECRLGRQGKKVSPTPLRLRRSRRSRPSARSSHREAVWSGRRTASSGEDLANIERRAQVVRRSRRRNGNPGEQKGRL